MFRRESIALLCLVALSACSSNPSQEEAAYKKAVTLPPLEVPPELTEPVGEGRMGLPPVALPQRSAVLPQVANVRVMREGDMRWLVVNAPASEVWPLLVKFWTQQGFELRRQDAALGLIETQWAENQTDIPEGFLRGLISKAFPNLYSADTRDKFRVRLEHGAIDGTTEVYLTHYGVEEVSLDETRTKWRTRPADPELVAEFLSRLLIYLGLGEEEAVKATASPDTLPSKAVLVTDGAQGSVVRVTDGYARAWRRTGIALDRIGLAVEDRDRARGIYFVRASAALTRPDEEADGWLGGLFNGTSGQETQRMYRIIVTGDEQSAAVAVRDAEGGALDAKSTNAILKRLYEELR